MKVEIMLGEISNVVTRTKATPKLITTIQFEAQVPPANIARLVNLQRQGTPLLATISSPQAVMDLAIEEDRGAEKAESPKMLEDL